MARIAAAPELKQNAFGVWCAHVTVNGRRDPISLRTKDRAEAEQIFVQRYQFAAPGALKNLRVTLRDAFNIYIANSNADNLQAVKRILELIPPAIAGMEICDIRPIHVLKYVEAAQKQWGRAYGSVYQDINTWRRACNYVFKIKAVPAGYDRPEFPTLKEPAPRKVWIERTEWAAWMAFITQRRENFVRSRAFRARLSRLERYCFLALYTAARRASIENLKWDHVDFVNGIIRFSAQEVKQSNKRKADVPIAADLLPVLQRAYSERKSEWVLDTPSDVYPTWGEAMEAFQKANPGAKHFTPHDLRRTAASWMLQNEAPIFSVASVLGNTVKRVQKVYGHLAEQHVRAAVDGIR